MYIYIKLCKNRYIMNSTVKLALCKNENMKFSKEYYSFDHYYSDPNSSFFIYIP